MMNRIDAADYKFYNGSTWSDPQDFETSYVYDENGNITSLERRSETGGLVDDLTYNYTSTGNRLNYVSDASSHLGFHDRNTSGADYDYDENGNMIEDKNKKIEIDYNYLNLPQSVSATYVESDDEISYLYDANGVKWVKEIYIDNSLNKMLYAGSFIYRDDDGDVNDDYEIDQILNQEGKLVLSCINKRNYVYLLIK